MGSPADKDRVSFRYRRSLALALLAVALLGVADCSARPSAPAATMKLRIASSTLPSSAAVFVAHEKGFFRAEGLDEELQVYGAGRLALEATLSGKADIATAAETPLVRAVLQGAKPQILATICEIDSGQFIVARRDRGISSARDLIGKRIGTLPGTSGDFFLHIFLITSNIEPKMVRIVPLTTDDIVSSLSSGTVDAVSVFAPYTIEAQDLLGKNAVVLDSPGLYTTFWNVSTRAGVARGQTDALAAFLRGIRHANAYMATHRTEAQRITARYSGLHLADVRRLWPTYHWTLELEQPLLLALEDESRWMSGETTTPDFLRYLDATPLKRIMPEAVRIIEAGD